MCNLGAVASVDVVYCLLSVHSCLGVRESAACFIAIEVDRCMVLFAEGVVLSKVLPAKAAGVGLWVQWEQRQVGMLEQWEQR